MTGESAAMFFVEMSCFDAGKRVVEGSSQAAVSGCMQSASNRSQYNTVPARDSMPAAAAVIEERYFSGSACVEPARMACMARYENQ